MRKETGEPRWPWQACIVTEGVVGNCFWKWYAHRLWSSMRWFQKKKKNELFTQIHRTSWCVLNQKCPLQTHLIPIGWCCLRRLCNLTKPAQSVNSVLREGKDTEKTIKQHYNMTPAITKAGLFISSLLLYHSRYMQRIRSVLGQKTK